MIWACIENNVRIVRRPRLPMQVICDRAGSAGTMDGDDAQPQVLVNSTMAMRFMVGSVVLYGVSGWFCWD